MMILMLALIIAMMLTALWLHRTVLLLLSTYSHVVRTVGNRRHVLAPGLSQCNSPHSAQPSLKTPHPLRQPPRDYLRIRP